MKTKIILITLLVCLPSGILAQSSKPKEAAASIFNQFLSSFTNADADGIVALFSEKALFWGTGSKMLVQDLDGIRTYFSALDARSPGEEIATALEYTILELSDTEAIISGMWQIAVPGENTRLPLRVSVAILKETGGWKIVQFHNSQVPK